MALNPKAEGKRDSECTETNEHVRQSSDTKRNSLSAATSTTSNQNGDQTGCEEGAMPQQEASDRRRSGLSEARSTSNSPLPGQRPAEEQPRRHFQIPRKIKERKGLYQFLPPDSREFEDLLKILSSFYLDISSRGIFSYSKARLIHNELLEKEFIEKRREMKQEGRTEPELVESYCFLFPDKSKLPWICEKGLSVGHTRVTTLGSPSMGVYLSKHSDLLQMNPFEAGACGDIVIFKVMRGRLKNIYENMPKSVIEPSPKFDCHVSKNASRVTSLLSYRAFELTQQYYFEFAFDEIKPRPRHVCPYAVVSFQYKGKEAAVAPMTSHRFNTSICEGSRGPVRTCYTVWSGPLVNKGQELCQVCLRSSTRPYLPFKLSEKLELSRGMQLEQVKRKIPSVLFSWETYSSTREVLKCGMSCSLFEVVSGKPKAGGGSLSGLLHKLERDRMVLVKPLLDRGFLFLLSSAQMVNPNEQRGRFGRSLQALFIFQEPRGVVKYASRMSEPELLSVEPPPPMLTSVQTFIPALHYALLKLRSNPVKDLSSGVERQAQDFLSRRDMCHSRPSQGPDYKQNLDERSDIHPAPRSKPNIDSQLRSYIHGPASYILSLAKAKDMMERIQQPSAPAPTPAPIPAPTPVPIPAPASTDYSPVSDWGGSGGSDRPERPERLQDTDRRKPAASHSNGGQPHTRPQPQPQNARSRMNQNEYDKDKMKQLLRLIQLHKKALVKEPGRERPGGGREAAWDPHSLKRKLAEDSTGGMNKHVRSDPQTNGEPSQAHGDDILEEGSQNLAAVMESMGIYDTDLRGRGAAQGSSNQNTQQLLKILLDTLNKAVAQGAASEQPDPADPSLGTGRGETDLPELGLRQAEQPPKQDYLEEEAVCSLGSPMSTCSMEEQPHSSDHPPWGHPAHPDKPQTFPDPDGLLLRRETVEPHQLQPQPKVQPHLQMQPHLQVQPHPQAQPPPQVLPHPQVQPHLQPHLQIQPQPQPHRPCSSLDNILNQELHNLSSGIQSIMQSQHIYYTSHEPSQLPHRDTWLPNSSFSDFVSAYVTPVPVHGHVKILREKIGKLLSHPSFQHMDLTDAHGLAPPPQGHYAPPMVPAPPPSTSLHLNPDDPVSSVPHLPQALNSQPPMAHLPPPHCLGPTSAPSPLPTPSASKTKAHAPQVKSSSSQRPPKPSSKTKPSLPSTENSTEVYSPSQVTLDSPVSNQTVCSVAGSTPAPSAPPVDSAHASPAPAHASPAPAPAPAPAPSSAPASAPAPATNLLFSQLKPEVFSSLVEIFKDVQKNTVKFYIHPGDEGEESAICLEIKEYLQSLGNAECKPQSFLENSSNLDKLLIIIQNEDIAAHVHKIPALVSLKKCSTVSFAGVDSLDDVKNHTYNELFVSGGFIVSDEFVLNPDCITQERLQAFLRFLEEQSSPEHPWQWKVHCKSQKKLKELGRLNSNAMGLLNLLTAYQKKHLVEFLPYHECDTQSRQAPDLDCLVKLQAQHTQQRHMIFLTERRFEMFLQYSRNGIVIASIDDIMNSFHSLIGGINQNELPTPPSTVVNDECVEEDMSLDSDDDTPAVEDTPGQIQEGGQEETSQNPPLPDAEEFRPPLPDQLTTATTSSSSGEQNTSFSNLSDLAALKTAISQFKANSQVGNTSPGGFAVNPHQSFLCPSTPWTSFPGYATSPAYPASPCSGTQEQDYRAPASAPTAAPGSALTAGPLTGQTPLPLEVKPPPPPHLMHLYVSSKALSGSDPSLVGAGGAFSVGSGVKTLPSTAVEASPSPIPTVRAYPDPTGVTGLGYAQADVAQHSFTTGATTCVGGATTNQGDRTLSGPGNGVWGSVGNSTGEAPCSQGGGMAGPVSQSGEREWTDAPGSSTPGSQGNGNPVNCTDSHGVGIGIPSAATRGGSVVRPMLPTHGGPGGGYGCIGALPGQIDGSLRGGVGPGLKGGYRGRGAPPGGPWPRLGPGPGRGHERGEGTGGAPCSWGYPLGRGRGRGQDYYSDYTYSHNYSP